MTEGKKFHLPFPFPGWSNTGIGRQNLLISGPPDIRYFRIFRVSVRRASGGSSGGRQRPGRPGNPEISDIPPDFWHHENGYFRRAATGVVRTGISGFP